MLSSTRWSVELEGEAPGAGVPDRESRGVLRAIEPTRAEVAAAVEQLSAHYNDAHNRTMMAHADLMSVDEVLGHFESLWSHGGRPFLLQRDGVLMGDADLRHFDGATRTAEFAIMVGARATQGRGLGTRYAVMVHALAFRALGIERIYVSIIPANRASQRLFAKLGYQVDDSPEARAYADEPDDVTMSIDRIRFEDVHAALLPRIRLAARE